MRDDDFERTLAAGSNAMADSIRPRPAEAVRARGDQRRRRQAAGIALAAVILVAGGGAAYAGTRGPSAPPPATRGVTPTPAPTTTSPRPSSPPPSPATSSSAPTASSAPPPSSPPPSSTPATSPPASTATPQVAQFLPQGPYADAVNSEPHYTITLSDTGAATFQGTITFVYQDGRTAAGGGYHATLLGNGLLTFVTSNGHTLSGVYQFNSFTINSCNQALEFAVPPTDCEFTYSPGATS
jgi:hypothetical protein